MRALPPHTVSATQLAEAVADLFDPHDSLAMTRPGRVGLEIELIAVDAAERPPRPVGLPRLERLLSRDPGLVAQARITFEPGAQIELSPPPCAGPEQALAVMDALIDRLRACGEQDGVAFVAAGVVPWHTSDQVGLQVRKSRYRAMQAHFDRLGGLGRCMMRQTAALQVCVDGARGDEGRERWEVANRCGPALMAAFANSPVAEARPTGAVSTRSLIWQRVDASRTGFEGDQVGEDPASSYREFAADALVIASPDAAPGVAPAGMTLRDWLEAEPDGPRAADLREHLTTLFPPVRPRGYLEIRYLDALPRDLTRCAVAAICALVEDGDARSQALEVVGAAGLGNPQWEMAARRGVRDARVRRDAAALLEIAGAALARSPAGWASPDAAERVREYAQRYTQRGRCPADDRLDAFLRDPEEATAWTT